MNRERIAYELEQRALAVCLVGSAICFGTGLLLQHGARIFTHAYGGTR